MKELEQKASFELEMKKRMFGQRVGIIKRMLPSKCTQLAPYKAYDGQMFVRARFKSVKDPVYYTINQDFDMTEEMYQRIWELANNKCNEI